MLVIEPKGKDLFGRLDNAVEESAKAMNQIREIKKAWQNELGGMEQYKNLVCVLILTLYLLLYPDDG